MSKFIDPLNVVTNGILVSGKNYKIIDPLGYYVIIIEEEVIDVDDFTGSGPSPLRKPKKKKKLVKKITLKIKCDSVDCVFNKEIIVDDINLTISDVKLDETKTNIILTLENTKIQDSENKKIVKIKL
jgi:hypothetical protein